MFAYNLINSYFQKPYLNYVWQSWISTNDIKIKRAETNNGRMNADIGIHDPGEVLLFTIKRDGNVLVVLVTIAHRDSVFSKD